MPEETSVDILLVDDTAENLIALEAILASPGHRIVRASSGREALRSLLRQDFAVILLDVNMPLMDGFETASLIRQRPRSATTPIIFVTAHGDDARLARGYSLGAVDFILTPVVPQILRAKVGVFAELFRKRAEIQSQAESLRRRAAQLHRLADAALAVNAADSIESVLATLCERALAVTEAASVAGTVDLGRGRQHSKTAGAPFPDRDAGPDGARITAPLVTRDGGTIGRIDLARDPPGTFSFEDRAVAVQLAEMASVAVQNLIYGEEREANRLKDEFLATVSHELRTPLSVILTWVGLLRRHGVDAATYARGLEVMERNAKAQAQLVDELVDVSRIFTGKLAMDMSPIDLREVVEIVADASRPGAEDRSLEIAMDLPDQPVVVRGDSARLQQVVWNLVANAIKFTEPGGHVRIALRQRGGSAELAVDDDGAGIEASFLPHVFDRFRQADSTTTRSHRGLGLGLAIVREIVERHGGEVSATSAGKGLGSRFVVQVPLAGEVASSSPQPHLEASEGGPARGARRGGPVPQEAAAAPASSVTAGIASTSPAADGSDDGAPRPALDPCALAGLGVLLVEDDAGASEAVSMLLRHAGASVRTADSVREALSLLKDWRPRVIVSDIGLPFEDGYALIRKLRLLDGSAEERIPVVAMTAYAHAEERARVLAEGFDAHLVKPVDSAVLLSTLAKYVVSPDG